MPFDGLSYSPERIASPAAKRAEAPAFTAQANKVAESGPLANARKALDFALRSAEASTPVPLSADQRGILEAFRQEPTTAKLQEVIYRDPSSGTEYRADDYFADTDQDRKVLADAKAAVQAYEATMVAANQSSGSSFADQYRRQWVASQDAAPSVAENRRDWRAYNQDPTVDASIRAARERVANGEAWQEEIDPQESAALQKRVQDGWLKHDEATTRHLEGIRSMLEAPMAGAAAFTALQEKQRAPAFTSEAPRARAEDLQPLPDLMIPSPVPPSERLAASMPVINTPPEPGYAPFSNEPPIIQPSTKKTTLLGRFVTSFVSRAKSLFG